MVWYCLFAVEYMMTKQTEEDFNTHFTGFQEGWKSCEQFKIGVHK